MRASTLAVDARERIFHRLDGAVYRLYRATR
jgi:hypothetical protein